MAKTKQVNVIYIDPWSRTVTSVRTDGSLGGFQSLVDGPIEMVLRFDTSEIWANEEGLLRPPYAWWLIGTRDAVLQGRTPIMVGKAFVAGVLKRKDGEHIISCRLPVERVRPHIVWLEEAEARDLWPGYQEARRRSSDTHHAALEARTGQKWHQFFIKCPFPPDETRDRASDTDAEQTEQPT